MNRSRVVGAVEKIYQLLMINVCFFITTLPLMIAFVVLKPEIVAIPFFLLASLPLGPTLFATIICLSKMYEEEEIPVFKLFFSEWRKNFKKGLGLTSLLVLVVSVGVVDLQFFSQIKLLQWLNPLVVLLMIMGTIIYSNCLYLGTQNKLPIKSLLKLGSFYAFKQLFISLVNGMLLTVLILAMIIKPAIGFLVFPSILIGILFWNSQKFVDMDFN